MGSIERAVLTGFICRLCSEMHRVVTHIYGETGRAMRLSDKINKYLPVNVSHTDLLPKTICNVCLSRLESQHKMMSQIELVRKKLEEDLKNRRDKPRVENSQGTKSPAKKRRRRN